MRLEGESYAIDVGTFVMNYHHGVLRLGVIKGKRLDKKGQAFFTVHFFEDHIHQRNVAWKKKLNTGYTEPEELRGDYLKPVSPEWLRNVLYAYRRYDND